MQDLSILRTTGRSAHRQGRAAIPVLLLATAVLATPSAAEEPTSPGTTDAGYDAGYDLGARLGALQRDGEAIDLDGVLRGVLDGLAEAEPATASSGPPAGGRVAPGAPLRVGRRRGFIDDYAALNGQREGVVTLASGVQYEVLETGSGDRPRAGGAVAVSYVATLSDGRVFDRTDENGEPARLDLDDIAVPGLREALLMMSEGDRWRVVIPPSMGFQRSGNNMLRRRDLIYEIELVEVLEAPAT